MKNENKQSIRMTHPEDKFSKRQFPFLGEAFHQNYNLPGKYLHTVPTEKIKRSGEKRLADVAYLVIMPDASLQIINVEDESTKVKKEELEKAYDYKTMFVYEHEIPVMTVITTTVPEKECMKEFKYSKTDSLLPHIISLPYDDAWNDLNRMITKIKKQEPFTESEGLKFITLPRCCKDNQAEAVERICEVILDMKLKERFTLIELVYCMQCMIHKYAKSDEDILRLQEMIGLKEMKIERMTILDEMKEEGRLEGRLEGREEGREEGIIEAKIEIYNKLINEPDLKYTPEELAGKMGLNLTELKKGK